MDLHLRGKTALVTGASKGIGLACARQLAEEGCHLHLASRTKADLERAKEQIQARHNVSVTVHAVDLSNGDAVRSLAAGCGEPRPALAEVEGTVTLDGKPVAGAGIVFHPDGLPAERWSSSGISDDAGRYRLVCVNGSAGACVGRHRVTVQERQAEPTINIDTRTERAPGERSAPQKLPRFPPAYAAPSSSPLIVEVTAGQGTYDLRLTTRPERQP